MSRPRRMSEVIALVSGENLAGKRVAFNLTGIEIKHIRRCLHDYNMIFDKDYNYSDEDPLTKRLHARFRKFGKMRRRLDPKTKKSKIMKKEKICAYKGCIESDNLTLDHIKRLCDCVEQPNEDCNLQLLCPKHHLLKELKTILWEKGEEIKRIRKRIGDVEGKGTTDCLGYDVLSKDKFEYVDGEYNE